MTGAERRVKRRGLRTVLRANYAYVALREFTFAYAIYTAYFSLQGLSATTIGVLVAFWSASAVIFELPSGALSDRFNRRSLLIVSPLFKAACFLVWIFADGTVWLYGLGFVLWSFGDSLMSGTKEAVLFEHIHSAKFGRVYEKVVGRDKAFEEIGAWSGVFFGGFIAFVNMELTLWLSVVPLCAVSIVAIWLTDVRSQSTEENGQERPSYLKNFANTLIEFRDRPRLRYLTLYIMLGVNLLWIYDEFDQLFFLAVSLPIWAFGLVGVVVGVLRVTLSLYAYRLKAVTHLGYSSPALAGVMLLVSGFETSLWMLVPLMSFYILLAPAEILVSASFQQSMEGASRATTTSAMSVLVELVSVVFFVGVGYVIDRVGVLPAYQLGGVCMLLFAGWAYWQNAKGFSIATP